VLRTMGIFRSEPMSHGTLVLPVDPVRARYFIDLIGSKANMQFEDMNAQSMHRPYKKYIQRIDEMQRILRFLFEELERIPDTEIIRNNVTDFLDNSGEYKLDGLESRLKVIYQDFIQSKENNVKITARRNSFLEESFVVKTAIVSMAQTPQRSSMSGRSRSDDQFEFEATRSLLGDEDTGARRALETMFSNIAGVIPLADQDRFSRTLFRATRGNAFTVFQQIPEPMQDPSTGREVQKSVFVTYFQDHRGGAGASAMNEKISKICASFGVNTYDWPASRESAEERRNLLQAEIDEQSLAIKQHEKRLQSEAAALVEPPRLGSNSLVEDWRLFCIKEKAIYATLNLFEGDKCLRADCWYPAADQAEIGGMLIQHSSQNQGTSSAALLSDHTWRKKSPPTFIRRNELTSVFQVLVYTIGDPRYGEADPVPLTIVTFPFLFGIMYGDVGHGAMVLMVGMYAVWNASNLKYSAWPLYAGRYMLVMMGFFAIYAGFLYNDFFSVGFNFFGSRWTAVSADSAKVVNYEPAYDIKNEGGTGPYPFGIDPAWHGAVNELTFMNSLKMKLSVVIGVLQMTVGLILRFSNSIYEKNWIDLLCECCPMMVFMCCFFAYMDYMILYKWVTHMPNPPSIINSMIAMGMWQQDANPMFGETLPRILMAATLLSVPLMLIPKPLILQRQAEMRQRQTRNRNAPGPQTIGRDLALGDEEIGGLQQDKEEDEEEPFDMGEVLIHQVIETIEYVLGTVSHTASYLRLWALSLAHQQLSLVFFNMTLISGMSAPFPLNMFAIYVTFAVWFAITIGVMGGMDVMECFLHVLRLHWIEFQSKFYRHDGYPFKPYRHRDLLEGEDA